MCLALDVGDAVGEQLDGVLAVVHTVVVVEAGHHTHHQVGASAEEVVEGVTGGFQVNFEGNFESLEDHLQ